MLQSHSRQRASAPAAEPKRTNKATHVAGLLHVAKGREEQRRQPIVAECRMRAWDRQPVAPLRPAIQIVHTEVGGGQGRAVTECTWSDALLLCKAIGV